MSKERQYIQMKFLNNKSPIKIELKRFDGTVPVADDECLVDNNYASKNKNQNRRVR